MSHRRLKSSLWFDGRWLVRRSLLLATFVCLANYGSLAEAQLNSGMLDFAAAAEQTLELVDAEELGLPPQANGVPIDSLAIGRVMMSWDDDTDDNGEVDLTSFSAEFLGSLPFLGDFTLTSGGPANLGFDGTLTQIVADSNGELVSALWTIETAFSFEFDNGDTIYTQSRATFEGNLGADLSGSVFVSTGALDGFLENTTPDVGDDLFVAISDNRTVYAVPEPSTACVLTGCLAFVFLRRRRW